MYKKSIDFPSLHNNSQILGGELNIVNEKRRTYERFEIILKNDTIKKKPQDLKDLIGKSIYINFPFHKEAKVIGIWDTNNYISLNDFQDQENKNIIANNLVTNKELTKMEQANQNWKKMGIRFSPASSCDLVFEYKPLGGINLELANNKFNSRNQFNKYFLRFLECDLGCMISYNRPTNYFLNIDNLISEKDIMYPILTPCLILKGKMEGSLGFITNHQSSNSIEVEVVKNKLVKLYRQIS